MVIVPSSSLTRSSIPRSPRPLRRRAGFSPTPSSVTDSCRWPSRAWQTDLTFCACARRTQFVNPMAQSSVRHSTAVPASCKQGSPGTAICPSRASRRARSPPKGSPLLRPRDGMTARGVVYSDGCRNVSHGQIHRQGGSDPGSSRERQEQHHWHDQGHRRSRQRGHRNRERLPHDGAQGYGLGREGAN